MNCTVLYTSCELFGLGSHYEDDFFKFWLLTSFFSNYKLSSNQKEAFLIDSFFLFPFLYIQRWNLKNLSRGLNPPKPGLN